MQIWISDFFCRNFAFDRKGEENFDNRQQKKLERITKSRLKSCEKYVKLFIFTEIPYQISYIMLQYVESKEKGGIL